MPESCVFMTHYYKMYLGRCQTSVLKKTLLEDMRIKVLVQGDIRIFYPFIQGSLKQPFNELFSSNLSLRNQYKYIWFNTFSRRICIKNKKANQLTIYGVLCPNVNVLPTRVSFPISSAGKTESVQKEVQNKTFLSNCFVIDGSYGEIVWPHVLVFNEHDILHFKDHLHLLKYYPVKETQNWFNSFSCLNQTGMQVSKSFFIHGK